MPSSPFRLENIFEYFEGLKFSRKFEVSKWMEYKYEYYEYMEWLLPNSWSFHRIEIWKWFWEIVCILWLAFMLRINVCIAGWSYCKDYAGLLPNVRSDYFYYSLFNIQRSTFSIFDVHCACVVWNIWSSNNVYMWIFYCFHFTLV